MHSEHKHMGITFFCSIKLYKIGLAIDLEEKCVLSTHVLEYFPNLSEEAGRQTKQ